MKKQSSVVWYVIWSINISSDFLGLRFLILQTLPDLISPQKFQHLRPPCSHKLRQAGQSQQAVCLADQWVHSATWTPDMVSMETRYGFHGHLIWSPWTPGSIISAWISGCKGDKYVDYCMALYGFTSTVLRRLVINMSDECCCHL